MAIKLQHGDSLYQVIEKVNELIDGKVQPGSGGSGGSSSGGSAAINGVQDMVYAEIDRAQAAEQYLQEQIDAIVIPESGNNSGATPDIGSIQPALIIESLRAATAEQFNAASLSAEVTRAQAAEQTLQTAISNEVTRATTAEQANATAISNEVTRATAAEQANATAISNEVTRATAAEQDLQDQIDTISGSITFTSNRVLVSDSNGKISASTNTTAELNKVITTVKQGPNRTPTKSNVSSGSITYRVQNNWCIVNISALVLSANLTYGTIVSRLLPMPADELVYFGVVSTDTLIADASARIAVIRVVSATPIGSSSRTVGSLEIVGKTGSAYNGSLIYPIDSRSTIVD